MPIMRKIPDTQNGWSKSLFRRRKTAKTFPARGILFKIRLLVTCCFLLAIFIVPVFFLYYQTLWSTKTMVGDNLDPTPWHVFPKPNLTEAEARSRAYKVFRCTYFSCSFSLSNLFRSRAANFLKENSKSCPSYFHLIHEDLAPWRKTGIVADVLQSAKQLAAFRVIIIDGRIYTEHYYHCVLTRTMFTLWGLVMLLERYPGMIPNVDLMFDCMDRPIVKRKDYRNERHPPPPLFRYCTDRNHFDIPFPDWSYWGWSEVNIKPWDWEMQSIFNASQRLNWDMRLPVAFWKGNPKVNANIRTKLMKCNSTEKFKAQILKQDWNAEVATGFKSSTLSDQCTHRFKIYAEGYAWSVSFKYIMACGSTVLLIDPQYSDFFMRSLVPFVEYWPIERDKICLSIKNAVDWGNNHTDKAQVIGQKGQEFLRDRLRMHNVYDYMFHLLQEYSLLQKFTPTVPPGAHEICRDSILCFAEPAERDLLKQSEVHNLDIPPPCSMPLSSSKLTNSPGSGRKKKSNKVKGG